MRDLLRSFAATAIIQLANIASGVMLARILLPEGRGELAAVMLWPPVIASLGLMGLAEATAFGAARRAIERARIFPSALVVAFVLTLVLVPVGWVVVDHVTATFSASARQAAFLYIAFIPLNHLGLVVAAMHQGGLSIGRWNVLRVCTHLVFTILIPVFYWAGLGSVLGFAVASLLANVAVVALGLFLARGRAWFAARPDRREMKSLLGFGLKVHVANAIAMLSDRVDQLVISASLSPSDLGVYVVAGTLARGIGGIGDTLATLAFPKIAHAEGRADQALVAGRYARAAVVLSVPAILIGMIFARWIIVVVFGPEFASAVPVAQVLLLAMLPFNVRAVLSATLKGVDRGLDAGAAQAIALGLSLALLAILLPAFGLMGAAVAVLLVQAGAVLYLVERTRRTVGLSYGDLKPRLDDFASLFTIVWAKPRPQEGSDTLR